MSTLPRTSSVFDDDKNTSLHFNAARGRMDDAVGDIENGMKLDIENYLGWTPLMMATRNGHLDVVKMLLEKRADATRKNKFGASIFLMAVASGSLEILCVILDHLLCGGVSKQSMESLFSPISVSILFNYEHVFTFLLQKGFNENALTPITGLTPLMFSSISENLSFSASLLTKGANPGLKNINGDTAHDVLQKKRGLMYQEHQPAVIQHQEQQQQQQQEAVVQQQQQPPPQHQQQLLLQPTQQVPKVMVFSPQPAYYQWMPAPTPQLHRKSSNLVTPNYCISPNITPVTPMGYYPQVFFPPNFAPSQFMSPMNYYHEHDDPLNARFNMGTMVSPIPGINIASPCGETLQYQPAGENFMWYNRTPVQQQ